MSIRIALPELEPDMDNYVAAISAAGMEPVLIRSLEQTAGMPETAGLILPGGVDIDPARYGMANEGSVGISRELDELQFTLLDAFVRAKKPVFGICRGHQLINVYFGGTLIQHIPTARDHAHKLGEPDRRNVSRNEAGSWIADVYGAEFAHNSSHHQAVDHPGEGLVVDSRCAADGVVEAMHHERLPVWSVQWHPERMCLAKARDDMVSGLPVLTYFREMILRQVPFAG